MKIKEGFMLRMVGGEHVVVAVGKAAPLLNGIIRLNDSGVELWNLLKDGTEQEDLAGFLRQTYGISAEQAKQDVERFLEPLRRVGCVE